MSYDRILMDLEESYFYVELRDALSDIHGQLPVLEAKYSGVPGMHRSLQDLDVYLVVAMRLQGLYTKTRFPESQAEVEDILTRVDAGGIANIPLFSSTPRIYDFSQFTVRGHYTRSATLAQYFQCMIWLGRTEFMLTKPVQQGVPEQTEEDIRRQVIDAALLLEALESSGADVALRDMDRLLASLVGESDNVSPAQLREVMNDAGVVDAASLADMVRVKEFQRVLEEKPFAGQRINSQILMSDPCSPEQLEPPSAFLLMGQRFIIDSYVFMNVVYDRIVFQGRKVLRMLPSDMDALFALGNDAAAQFLQDDLAQFPYASNLNALRYLIDSYGDDFWNASLYGSWLNAIRSLNIPGDVEGMPPFMRTAAWWQQKMNTQLASWAQLRHDNLLYAKPSYTGGAGCSFPRAYVEPVPEFYRRLEVFATAAADVFGSRQLTYQEEYFRYFATVMDTLGGIAAKELSGAPLTPSERDFASGMLYRVPNCVPTFDGWYPRLFYGRGDGEPVDIVTADVHTAPTDAAGNFVGWVMHAGTGRLNTAVIIAPHGDGGNTAFVGPVLSYYSHITANFERFTDEQWKEAILENPWPRPEWTNNYLADVNGMRRPDGPSLMTMVTPVDAVEQAVPAPATLDPAYPNPAGSDGTMLRFTMHRSAPMRLAAYDLAGRRIAMLADRYAASGTYFLKWDGTDASGTALPAGVYILTLESAGTRQSQRVVLTR
jgi:hypothetical protein